MDTVYYTWENNVIVDPFNIEDETIAVPQEPGLGVDVDETKLNEYRTPT